MPVRGSLVLLAVLLSGCTTYVFQGTIEAPDSSGTERQHLVYWSKTERPAGFDTVSGGIRVLTECSTNTMVFAEREDAIVFRRRPNDRGVGTDVPLGGPCGQVLDAERIRDLDEGVLRLTVHCEPVGDEFSVGNQAYLQAQEQPYRFPISRKKVDDLEEDTPERPACRG